MKRIANICTEPRKYQTIRKNIYSLSSAVDKLKFTVSDSEGYRYLSHQLPNAFPLKVRAGMIFIACLLMMVVFSGGASAGSVTYYLYAANDVDIGADGTTNIATGNTDQDIPPVITALLSTSEPTDSDSARSDNHPTGSYVHSRWYFTSDYPSPTQIGANPSGRARIKGGSKKDKFTVKLYDYDPLSGSRTLIGSSSKISINGHHMTGYYSYDISSSDYIVPQNHRLMLQFDFEQNSGDNDARVYTTNSDHTENTYITVVETPVSSATYSISGYILNGSGSGIVDATVQTDTGLVDTTDAKGYYQFDNLDSGTYLITASKSGYQPSTITKTVTDSDIINANLTLSLALTGEAEKKIFTVTNRFVILDDNAIGLTESGFSNPYKKKSRVSQNWFGEKTTIRVYTLYLDDTGRPLNNQNVEYSLINPGGSLVSTKNSLTDANGLAESFFDLDGQNYYGHWTINAMVDGQTRSTTFIYNWWGCNYNAGKCDKDHAGKHPKDLITPSSPYLLGWDKKVGKEHDDRNAGPNGCIICHRSYDGTPGPATNEYNTNADDSIKSGPHTGIRCSTCHGDFNNHYQSSSGARIGSCYGESGCHAFRNDISGKSTLDGQVSAYSTISEYHNEPPTIPCIICHGPMHGPITKPYPGLTNSITEEEQCTACHTDKGKHSTDNPVECTACHSQDAHAIKVLSTDGTYKDRGSLGAITSSTTHCTACHQAGMAADFLGNLTTTYPQAYSTNYDPEGLYNDIHPTADCSNSCHNTSDFHNIGKGGGGPDCLFCHNSTGTATHRVDENAIYSGIHGGLNPKTSADPNSKCWGCHQSDGNPPPETSMGDIFSNPYQCPDCHLASGQNPGAYGAFVVDEHFPSGSDIMVLAGTGNLTACITCHNKSEMKVTYTSPDGIYTNFSLVSHYGRKRTDLLIPDGTNCSYCHQAPGAFGDVFLDPDNTNIIHNNGAPCSDCHGTGRIHDESLVGGGGPDCVSCHDGSGRAKVDVSALDDADYIHYGLNNLADTGTLSSANRMCWACHAGDAAAADDNISIDELPVSGHPAGYNTPRTCTGCHTGSVLFSAPEIIEHNPTGADIVTTFSCVQCHNNSIRPFTDTRTNLSTNSNTADPDFDVGRVSHYANTSDLAGNQAAVNYAYCEQCHNDPVTGDQYGVYDTNTRHDQKDCITSNCHSTGGVVLNLHDTDLTKPSLSFQDTNEGTNYCMSCHNSGAPTPGYHGTATSKVYCNACHMNTSVTVTAKTITPGTRNTNTEYHTDDPVPSYTYNGMGPGNNSLVFGSVEYNRSRCSVCHDAADQTHNPGVDCVVCHTSNTGKPTWHSTNISGGGGPDCINCHDIVNPKAQHLVDASVVATGIHARMNNNSGNPNEVCWGCHQTGGTEPSDMGDRYTTPYVCTDCHLSGSPDAGIYGAPVVAEHYRNGSDILAVTNVVDNISSCLKCHQNISTMILANNDAENGTFDADGNGIYGGTTNPYHYGRNRMDMQIGTETNCSYCHKVLSEFDIVFEDPANNTHITHDSGQPCSNCHGSGRIHDESLLGAGGPDCISCHDIGGPAASQVDVAAINSSVHRNLNAGTTNPTGNPDNQICWGCHQSKGTAPGAGTHYDSKFQCVDCHSNQVPPAHVAPPNVEAEFLSGDAPVGPNMTFNRDTIIFFGFYGDETGNNETYSKHTNLNPGGYPSLTGPPRDSNKVCYNCHNSQLRAFGEDRRNNWDRPMTFDDEMNSGSCRNLCHQYPEESIVQANPHTVVMTQCTDCHAMYAEGLVTHNTHNTWFNYSDPPEDYGLAPVIGNMLNQSTHRRMVEDSSGHPSNGKGCLVCHSSVNAEIIYNTSPLIIKISDNNGTHGWNSDPACTGCHQLDTPGNLGPAMNGSSHSSYANPLPIPNSDCLVCHGGAQNHGHSVVIS